MGKCKGGKVSKAASTLASKTATKGQKSKAGKVLKSHQDSKH